MKIKNCAWLTALLFLSSGFNVANAATIYATGVIFASNSDAPDLVPNGNRNDAGNALGAPDGTANPQLGFYSLGLEGIVVLDFGQVFQGPSTVFEITGGSASGYPEQANIWVGNTASGNLSDFTLVGSITNLAAQGGGELVFNPAVEGTFRYLLIQDNSSILNGPSDDGFDVDAIGVTAVPLPASVFLFGSALLGLAVVKRRKT